MFDTTGRVSALRTQRGMSVEELARRSGLNPSTLRTAESRGTQLSVATVELICGALGMTLSEFFAEGGTKTDASRL